MLRCLSYVASSSLIRGGLFFQAVIFFFAEQENKILPLSIMSIMIVIPLSTLETTILYILYRSRDACRIHNKHAMVSFCSSFSMFKFCKSCLFHIH